MEMVQLTTLDVTAVQADLGLVFNDDNVVTTQVTTMITAARREFSNKAGRAAVDATDADYEVLELMVLKRIITAYIGNANFANAMTTEGGSVQFNMAKLHDVEQEIEDKAKWYILGAI